jgi:hypothetical protein
MKASRIGVLALASWALLGPVSAEVRTIQSVQELERPAGQTFSVFGHGVAIDGRARSALSSQRERRTLDI